jgi:hypothetical protein
MPLAPACVLLGAEVVAERPERRPSNKLCLRGCRVGSGSGRSRRGCGWPPRGEPSHSRLCSAAELVLLSPFPDDRVSARAEPCWALPRLDLLWPQPGRGWLGRG